MGAAVTKEQIHPYLQFPCGVLRGALAQLGVEATVVAEVDRAPRWFHMCLIYVSLSNCDFRCAFRIFVKPAATAPGAPAAKPSAPLTADAPTS